ncbi:hypothetical protein OF83DRAFT_669093 [Amylostereum chailletii]|nr:hypothetical protein OF83DRAFT_669093 [Amylostereum chailletii]
MIFPSRTTLPLALVFSDFLLQTVNGRVVYLCGNSDDNDDQHGDSDSDDDDDDGKDDDPGDAVTTVSGSLCSSTPSRSHYPTQSPGATSGSLSFSLTPSSTGRSASLTPSSIGSSTPSATSVAQTNKEDKSSRSLSEGQIVGIILAVFAALVLLGLLFLWKRNIGRASKQPVDLTSHPPGAGSSHQNLVDVSSAPVFSPLYHTEGTGRGDGEGDSNYEHLPLFSPADRNRFLENPPHHDLHTFHSQT